LRRAGADHAFELIDFPLIPAEAGIHTYNADIRTHFSSVAAARPSRGSEDRLAIVRANFGERRGRARAFREKRR
jgi:hypothetical protein